MSDGVQVIRHGMFIMPFHDPAKPPGQCYDEDLELVVRAEELGFTEFWVGEHHTMKYENIVMPEIFIGWARPGPSGWGPPRSASSSTIPRTSPAAWRSSTIWPGRGRPASAR